MDLVRRVLDGADSRPCFVARAPGGTLQGMRRKKVNLHDEPEVPVGVPDRKPKTSKRSCEACAVVGPKATVQLCLRRTGKPPGKFVGNATDVCTLMRGLETADRESFYTLHLDVRHNIVDIDRVAVGTQSGVEVHPREVFKSAMLSGANALILAHNHPSGIDQPSYQDTALTRRLKEVGELVGIPVLDHIVVGRDSTQSRSSCTSMAAKGLLGPELKGDYPLLANKRRK
jgi:DNA repair protein RadC